MTEPTNPLFEDEKEFLERKKLEYERALRGDVEEIKETTVQVSKVALVGAGVVGGIWLLSKAFGGGKKKKKHKKHRHHFEDYAGFDGFDENDREMSDLASDFQDADYFYDGEQDFDADETVGDGFYDAGSSSTSYDTDADDNGFGDYPDFPAHSTSQHGDEADDAAYEDNASPAHSYASSNSYQARPYDDSRRLPHSTSFDEDEADEVQADAPASEAKRSVILPALIAFAKSETGRVVVAQAAAVALAFVTKAVQGFMPSHEEETGKNADLAASSASVGVSPATWPATSAAQDAADASHHEDANTYREPLA